MTDSEMDGSLEFDPLNELRDRVGLFGLVHGPREPIKYVASVGRSFEYWH